MTGSRGADLLDFVDQAAASATRATGRNSLIQAVWVYDRPLDLGGLEKFHRALGRGLLGRRVQASPLPFGRDRWVLSPTPSPLVVETVPRPRQDVSAWVDERAATPVDPWSGPAWHLAALPLDDGGTAVTLVVSHVLADWGGTATAIAEAVAGTRRPLPYPERATPRWRALLRDLLLTVLGIPAAIRAARDAARLAKERLAPGDSGVVHRAGTDRWAVLPVDRGLVTERAESLGATETSLLVAVAAAIAAVVGWVRPADGAAAIGMSVDRRVAADLRGNAIVDANVVVDPALAEGGVAAVRSSIREALKTLPEAGPYDVFGPLVPLLPRSTVASLVDAPPDPAEPVTTCAGIRELPVAVQCPDGTQADHTWARLAWSDLPGRASGQRPPYLYVGWTATAGETSLFVASNLQTEASLDDVLCRALSQLGVDPSGTPTPSGHR